MFLSKLLNCFVVSIALFTLITELNGQEISNEYWDAILVADNFFEQKMYGEAAKAYKVAFTKDNAGEFANSRIYAAAANCMIDNEIGVKENLNKMIDISTKDDMRKVLVNYEIFNKYKDTDWWKKLEASFDKRLAKLIAHHKNLKIFNKRLNYKYRAIRINANSDTLANTTITVVPDGTGWGDEAATLQTQAIFIYAYSKQDSLDHISELKKTVLPKFWVKSDTTGITENEQVFEIHPFRNNEFFKTEVAPFPSVIFPISDENMKKVNDRTIILRGWGSYSPSETVSTYDYLGVTLRKYKFNKSLNCHKFIAEGVNNKHGLSTIEYFFHKDFGFTEMIYKTYDGDTILFEMEEVISVLSH